MKKSHKIIILCAVIASAWVSIYSYSRSPSNPDYRFAIAKVHILENLNTPATAIIHEPFENYVSGKKGEKGRIWIIVGKVDAQNRFGAVIRNTYQVALEYKTLELVDDVKFFDF